MRRIRQVTFDGGHYQRGLAQGRRLRGSLVVPPAPAAQRRFVEECMRAAERLYPPALDEFEGLVEGGGFDRAQMMAYYFARLESRLGGCTMFAVGPGCRSKGRGPIIGRNYDWAVGDLRWCELHRYNLDRGMRRIAYTHHWAGTPDVLNEAGLYVAIASLPPEPVRAPGVQWSILVEMISETCTTVDEAVGVCAQVRHLRAMSYLLADAGGSAAVVEATPGRVRVRRPADGSIVAANAPRGGEQIGPPQTEASGYLLPGPVGPGAGRSRNHSKGRSERRVARASHMLRERTPSISEQSVRCILRDHRAPVCTGDHDHADGGRWATIWSGICKPADRSFAIAPGLPCRHRYQTFTLGR